MSIEPRKTGSATERSAETRRRLLDAAAQAFADRGFHGTTTRDIAGAAGMSPAAVYVHYRSKEELLFELSRAGHLKTIGNLDVNDDPDASPVDRLSAVMRGFAEWHARGHTTARIVNYELAALEPEHRREIGLLRAVGMSRAGIRRTIVIEALIIAVFGAVLGMIVGVAFGALLQRILADQGIDQFAVNAPQLVGFLILAALGGVLAALWPAWRGSRLRILDAIATE